MTKMIAGALSAALLVAPGAQAATTQIVSGDRALTVSAFDPLGQVFTADANRLDSFGFEFKSLNPSAANADITFTLYAGEGFTGAVLASLSVLPTTLPLANRASGWLDFDLGGVSLVSGQRYTAALTSVSSRFALNYGPTINIFTGAPLTGDAYAGGRLLATGTSFANDRVCNTGICDANFRFTSTDVAAAVPEPATWSLMILGFGAAAAAMRRRRAAALPA